MGKTDIQQQVFIQQFLTTKNKWKTMKICHENQWVLYKKASNLLEKMVLKNVFVCEMMFSEQDAALDSADRFCEMRITKEQRCKKN